MLPHHEDQEQGHQSMYAGHRIYSHHSMDTGINVLHDIGHW